MSRKIALTQGQITIVDDDMFDYLNKLKWCAQWNKDTRSFYAIRKNKNGHTVYMTREILGLKKGDKRQGDHIDHNTLDNRSVNLRIATHQQNHFNRKKSKGFWWDKITKRYRASIMLNGKHIHLGRFQTTEEAHNAYLKAKEKYHKF